MPENDFRLKAKQTIRSRHKRQDSETVKYAKSQKGEGHKIEVLALTTTTYDPYKKTPEQIVDDFLKARQASKRSA